MSALPQSSVDHLRSQLPPAIADESYKAAMDAMFGADADNPEADAEMFAAMEDMEAEKAAQTFTITLGTTDTQTVWTERETLSWEYLAAKLTSHAEGSKRGSCVVPAVFRGTERKKDHADQIDVVFLDSDSGATLADIGRAVKDLGWDAIVSSTHSHMTTRTEAKQSHIDRFFSANPAGTYGDFLRQEKGYLPSVAEGADLVSSDGSTSIIGHQPCPKFRVALPLETPWSAANYASQGEANAAWKERIEALASALGLSHDQSCTDTSRLFYLPRRPPGGAEPETLVIAGTRCDIFALPTAPKPADLFDGATGEAQQRQQADERPEYVDPISGEVIDIATWAASLGRRFLIAKALHARVPHVFTGLVSGARVHIDCPHGDAHTNAGRDNATFVTNAGQSQTNGFVVHCRHAHCTGLDRGVFVKRMLEQRWLTCDDLADERFLVTETYVDASGIIGQGETVVDAKRNACGFATDAQDWRLTKVSSLQGKPVPVRRWIVPQWIPARLATLLYADGGVGKTLLGLQLMAATSLASKWCGIDVEPCKSIGLFSEDDADELHIRLEAIRQHYSASWEDINGAFIIDATGQDNTLARFERNGAIVPTARFRRLREQALDVGARLITIDTAATTFGGNENDRGQVTAFVGGMLTGLAQDIDGAVVLNAHPSKSGLSSGDLTSGSTGWNNSCRSRLTLARPTDQAGRPILDSPERVLTRWKANGAAAGEIIPLRWEHGVFVRPGGVSGASGGARKNAAEAAFMDGMRAQAGDGINLSATKAARNYAPKVLAITPEGADFKMPELVEAMQNLLKRGVVKQETYRQNSRDYVRIVVAGEGA
jgi:hypothetical protein